MNLQSIIQASLWQGHSPGRGFSVWQKLVSLERAKMGEPRPVFFFNFWLRRLLILVNINACFDNILPKCAIGPASLFISYRLEAFSRGFFIATLPVETFPRTVEKCELSRFPAFQNVSTTLYMLPKKVANTLWTYLESCRAEYPCDAARIMHFW